MKQCNDQHDWRVLSDVIYDGDTEDKDFVVRVNICQYSHSIIQRHVSCPSEGQSIQLQSETVLVCFVM